MASASCAVDKTPATPSRFERTLTTCTMSGYLARAVAQTVVFCVNVVSKAFMQAYSKAQAGGGSAGTAARGAVTGGSRMPLDQARQVLNLEKAFTREDVAAQFEKYYASNDPDKGGSFYVQSKVFQARDTLLGDMKRQAEAKAASTKAQDEPMR